MATKKKGTSKTKTISIGSWTVKRQGTDEVVLKLPKGMVITGEPLSIDDVLAAIAISKQQHIQEKDEPSLKCCSGNVAIA